MIAVSYIFHILKMNVIAAAIIFIVIFSARFTRKKYSAKWKYFMWMAISVFLLVPVNFSAKSPVRLQIDVPSGRHLRGQHRAEEAAEDQNAVQKEAAGNQNAVQNAGTPSGQRKSQISVNISSRHISVYGVLEGFGIIWIAGMVFLILIRVLRYNVSLRKMMRWSYPVEDKHIVELYRWICLKKHIRRPPVLLISPRLSTPVLAGLRHTGVYLTEEAYDPEELKFILSHELTHYKRRDLWYKMLLMAAGTVYWFNPALYWMQREAEKDIENLCDGSVVERYTWEEQQRYGRLLLKTAALQNHVSYLAASLNDSTLVFKERIMYMRNLKQLKRNVVPAVLLLVVMLGGQLLVGSAVSDIAVNKSSMNGRNASGASNVSDIWESQGMAGLQEPAGARGIAGAQGITGTQEPGEAQGIAGAQESGEVLRVSDGQEPGGAQGIWGGQEPGGAQVIPGVQEPGGAQGIPGGQEPGGVQGIPGTQEPGGAQGIPGGAGVQTVPGSQEPSGTQGIPGGQEPSGAQGILGVQEPADGQEGHGNSSPADEPSAGTQIPVITNQQITLYQTQGPGATYVNLASDGAWYDGAGTQYKQTGQGQWICPGTGENWTDVNPKPPVEQSNNQVAVKDEEGYNVQTLYQQGDGSWLNIAGGVYHSNGDGTWTGQAGEVWYDSAGQ